MAFHHKQQHHTARAPTCKRAATTSCCAAAARDSASSAADAFACARASARAACSQWGRALSALGSVGTYKRSWGCAAGTSRSHLVTRIGRLLLRCRCSRLRACTLHMQRQDRGRVGCCAGMEARHVHALKRSPRREPPPHHPARPPQQPLLPALPPPLPVPPPLPWPFAPLRARPARNHKTTNAQAGG
jgi:hypothetical protein